MFLCLYLCVFMWPLCLCKKTTADEKEVYATTESESQDDGLLKIE